MNPNQAQTQTNRRKSPRGWSRYWVAEDVGGIELLHARFLKQRFVPHTHDTFTIGVILEGALGFDHERREGVAPAGQVSVVNPGELHTGFAAGGAGWTYRNFFLPTELMRAVAEDLGILDLPFFSKTVIENQQTAQSLLELHRVLDTSEMVLERESRAVQVLGDLIVDHAVTARPPVESEPTPDTIRRSVERMHDEFSEPLSLEDLAREVGLSRFQFLRHFRRSMGLTPHAYLLQVRIQHAKEQLLQGRPIVDVALDCGFSDQSHLNRRCKEVFGVTPGVLAQGSVRR